MSKPEPVGLSMSLEDLIKNREKPVAAKGRGNAALGASGGVQKPAGARVDGRGGRGGSTVHGRGGGRGGGRGNFAGGRGGGRGEFVPMPMPVLMQQPAQPQADRQSLATIQKLQAAIAQKEVVIAQQQALITQLQQQLIQSRSSIPHGGQRHVHQPTVVEEPAEEIDPTIWRGLTCQHSDETGHVEVAYRCDSDR